MRIAIYGKQSASENIAAVSAFIDRLEQSGVDLIVFDYLRNHLSGRNLNYFATHTELAGSDFLVSFGGDGTLLDSTTFVRDSEIPILGINTGRLGFLTEFGKDEVNEAAEALINNAYLIDNRALLKIENPESDFDGYPYALNELTVHKKDTTSMVTVDVHLNNVFLNSYWADGLIISTPTGSTAYSLSCEGPILTPDNQSFIINPIAPHNLNVRPLVIPDNGLLRLTVQSRSNDFLASLDSRSKSLNCQTTINISKAPFSIKLVRRPGQSFLNTLRDKLLWGNDRRN
ncbi:MAG: NAD kinase [Sphingobacteriales bacterium JAD_PAG50586_3]|nr:MAG: NAD kinase [Sphingobacteriales bacterium JAD_PAG50586_3]